MPVNIVGVSQATRTPGVYLQIVFGAGTQSANAQVDKCVVIGHSSNGGSADVTLQAGQLFGPDTTKQVQTSNQAATVFGQNSELTKFGSSFWRVNQQNPLYFVPVTDTGTFSGVKIAFSGSVTYTNTLNIWINSTLVQVPLSVGQDLVNTVPTAIINAVNSQRAEFLAQTTPGSSFAIIAAGSPGNRNTLSVQTSLVTADSALTVSLTTGSIASPPASGTFTGAGVATSVVGYAGTGAPSTTADMKDALETVIGSNNFYHKILLPGADEASSTWANTLNNFAAHLTAKALPTVGVRTFGYTGATMTSTNLVDPTLAILENTTAGTKSANLNNPRLEIVWTPGSDAVLSEVMGTFVGAVSLFEQNLDLPYALNFCAFGSTSDTAPYWGLSQPRNRWTESAATIEAALTSGLTVVGYNNGASYIVRRSTTKCVDGSSAFVPDQRIADAHKVLIMDKLAQDIIANLKQAMKGKVLVDAPADNNDSIPANSVAISFIKGGIYKILDDYANRSLIENVQASKSAASFSRSSTRADTIQIQIPIDVIDIAAIALVDLEQVG